MKPLKVFIGYDPREDDAYKVCLSSILQHASIPLHIVKLELSALEKLGLYWRTHKAINGQMWDDLDGRPFSTQFSFSRFLVPMLSEYDGWAVFVDCDFLFTDDIAKLLPLLDPSKAVMLVKHNHIPAENIKMDGQRQESYFRKNWSSFVAYNCSHRDNYCLTAEVVSSTAGRWLHGFNWIHDRNIGELPVTWNWLSGVNESLPDLPIAIHFTLGVPSMKGHENSPYADLWRDELTRSAQQEIAS